MKRKQFLDQIDNRAERKERHLKRAQLESEQMRISGEKIKIDHWNREDEANNWIWIRVNFEKSIIPVTFKSDIKSVLSELFHEHL
jgi:hypothetical protein